MEKIIIQPGAMECDWGKRPTVERDIHTRVLFDRIWWFITMRWYAAMGCFLGALITSLPDVPFQIQARYPLAVGFGLLITNTLYYLITKNYAHRKNRGYSYSIIIRFQILTDFVCCSLLTYACGTVETPVFTLFLTHIILSTLFFESRQSLFTAFEAWLFATLPLILQCFGWLQLNSIFNPSLLKLVVGSAPLTVIFVTAIGFCFLVTWFLVNEITKSLRIREGQVVETVNMLKRMDVEKSQTTLRATHELKAPFAAIESYVFLLRDGYAGEIPKKAQNIICRIGERCELLRGRITEIIHLSNLKTLVLTEMNFKPLELGALLEKEVRENSVVGAQRNIRINYEHGPPTWVSGSRSHLYTLFSNLIRNAINYSYENGVVDVRLKAEEGKARVEIRDRGIGIPAKNMSKIFDEHFRSNNAVTHKKWGSGLGLAMVKETARMHGAVIHVNSVEKEGTVFQINFKRISQPEEGGTHE